MDQYTYAPGLGAVQSERPLDVVDIVVVVQTDALNFSLAVAAEVELQDRIAGDFVGKVDLPPAVIAEFQRGPGGVVRGARGPVAMAPLV